MGNFEEGPKEEGGCGRGPGDMVPQRREECFVLGLGLVFGFTPAMFRAYNSSI